MCLLNHWLCDIACVCVCVCVCVLYMRLCFLCIISMGQSICIHFYFMSVSIYVAMCAAGNCMSLYACVCVPEFIVLIQNFQGMYISQMPQI